MGMLKLNLACKGVLEIKCGDFMSNGKLIANNKKAYHDYFIDETYEAGIVLTGTEVKSIRMGKASIKESYVEIKDGEAFSVGMNISPYEMGNRFNVDPFEKKKVITT